MLSVSRVVSRPGLVALAAVAGQDIAQISADNLPFSIIRLRSVAHGYY